MRAAVLVIHVAAGVTGLVLGVPALLGNRQAVRALHHTMAGVCASAVALAAMDWAALWWFVPIAAGSYGFALSAYGAGHHRGQKRMRAQVRGVGGAYISLWTALVVVWVPDRPALWLVPMALGVLPLEVFAHRATGLSRATA